jgi:hypothetical protein
MSLYRCAECGHGRYLWAWAQACSYGPLATDGQLESHETVEDCFLFVDSIQCSLHPDAQIQTKVEGRFHVWVTCQSCKGESWEEQRRRGRYGTCKTCKGKGGTWELPLCGDVSGGES